MSRLLIDTSAYVGFKKGLSALVDTIVTAEEILFSTVVMGELMFGFRNGSRLRKNMQELQQFLEHERVKTVSVGEVTADRYSRIAARLRRQGTPVPTNDVWIAAQTFEHGAELITLDRHFEKIEGLILTIP